MFNTKRRQKAMEEIVRLKETIRSNKSKLDNAYLKYYRAIGLTDDQAARLIK